MRPLKPYKNSIFVLILLVMAVTACSPRTIEWTSPLADKEILLLTEGMSLKPGDYRRLIQVDNRERDYYIHVPTGFQLLRPIPVVMVFHGGGGNALGVAWMTHFSRQSDASGFLAIYPDGSRRFKDHLLTWNGGTCCGYAVIKRIDDVSFIRAILADLSGFTEVDEKRIFATGMSNGGIMSYRLACDAADLFAAIGPVSGTQNYIACAPSEPVSVLHIHGTADEHLPYEGGKGSKSIANVNFASVASSISYWTDYNQCPVKPVSTQTGSIIHDIYAPCAQGTAVELYTIVGGLHAWPGGHPGWAGGDDPTMDLNASQIIWEFFAAHPKP